MIAGTAPSEKIARKKPAMTISGKARRISMKRRTKNLSQRLAVRLLAATKQSRKPKVKPISVATTAMLRVSIILEKYSGR